MPTPVRIIRAQARGRIESSSSARCNDPSLALITLSIVGEAGVSWAGFYLKPHSSGMIEHITVCCHWIVHSFFTVVLIRVN